MDSHLNTKTSSTLKHDLHFNAGIGFQEMVECQIHCNKQLIVFHDCEVK